MSTVNECARYEARRADLRTFRMAALALCLLLLGLVPAAYSLGLRVVNTESVPRGLYVTRGVGRSDVVRGAYVCLPATASHAPAALRAAVLSGLVPESWKREPLLKRVVGVAGDRVTYERDRGVRVSGRLLERSVALEVDGYGNALGHPPYPLELGAGEVWLSSEHARGFDSRYFGVVRIEALTCVGAPVWTM